MVYFPTQPFCLSGSWFITLAVSFASDYLFFLVAYRANKANTFLLTGLQSQFYSSAPFYLLLVHAGRVPKTNKVNIFL